MSVWMKLSRPELKSSSGWGGVERGFCGGLMSNDGTGLGGSVVLRVGCV